MNAAVSLTHKEQVARLVMELRAEGITDNRVLGAIEKVPRELFVPTTFKAGGRAGDYIWHDSKGWHVRVTHPGSKGIVFSGTIHSSAPLDAAPVKLEKNDWIAVSADHKTITYRFTNYGYIDGFDFTTSCAKALSFRGLMGGHRLGIGHIWIGHNGRHPLENPFVVRRIG